MTSTVVNWGLSKVKLTWKAQQSPPPRDLVTSVHGFCFFEGKLLLVNLNDRGWDFPGGHIEQGESPEACFQREAMEEAYVSGECTLLGCIEVDHTENPNWNNQSPYPMVGYQMFYCMDIISFHPFEAKFESFDRTLIEPMKLKDFYTGWNAVYEEILTEACRRL
ncbi:NUDIX domain protein [Bacillus sp. THAF10]|uniref:NUDIX hydrolase n=1 Tax=Bacillus sp. THAF10 TaxID=2587848 RepID=UPI001268B09D|nr:NUDIX domain-containing protein [Bacillus sp. THAF10]QFT89642.1 NUDIX domain protein [Bacillus sp. THAF10]